MSPLFSIVTINYNDKVGLRRTIESVLQQEFTDYEHIIIDGDSTDGSVDVIKEYEHRYKPGQLTWVSEPDGGIYPAMNKGIRMAKGSFLNMLNGGDWYEPKALSVIHKYIGSNQTILAFHSTQKYWSLNNNSELKYVFSRQNTPQSLNYQTLEHQSFFYHISLHQIYGMYREDFQYASDRAFMCKLFFKNHVSLLQLEEKLVNFITGGRGDTLAGDEDSQITSEFFYSSAKSPDIETLQKKVSKAFIKLIKILLPYGIVRVYQKIKGRKMSKISLIVPFYNVEPWIGACLDSMVHQTLDDIEIICIDDCSPDGSRTIVQQYMDKDPRIKLITHTENKRQGGARNTGVQHATGEYIWFIDSDDMIVLGACEVLYNILIKNQATSIIFAHTEFNDGESMLNIPYFLNEQLSYDYDLNNDNHIFGSTFPVKAIISREFYLQSKFRFMEKTYFEDWFIPLCRFNQSKILSTSYVAYLYRKRPNSVTTTLAYQQSLYWSQSLLGHVRDFIFPLLEEMRLSENAWASLFVRYQVITQLYSPHRLFNLLAPLTKKEWQQVMLYDQKIFKTMKFTVKDWYNYNIFIHNDNYMKPYAKFYFVHFAQSLMHDRMPSYFLFQFMFKLLQLKQKYTFKAFVKFFLPYGLVRVYQRKKLTKGQ